MKMSELVSKTIEDAEVALAKKNKEFPQMAVSVQAFGAKGDGVTDDTEAIQSVIDSLENGGVIFFPEGNYLVSSSLVVNKSNITLKGLDKNLVQIKDHPSMTTAAPILLITGVNKTNRIENITIEGIKIRNGSAVTGDYVDGKDGIRIIFANNITIEHCTITEIQGEAGVTVRFCRNMNFLKNYVYRCTYAGFDALDECEDIRILNNEFDTLTSLTTPNTYGIVTGYDLDYGVSDFPIKNLWIERNIVRNNPRWEGIDSHGGQNIWIRDNYVENCKTGIMVSSAESDYFRDITTKNVFIENNVLIRGNGETGLHGLYVGGNREMFIENVVIKGNEVTGFGYNDKGNLVVEYSINAEVAHNTIDEYRYNGIGITGWNNDIKVHDNLIKNKDVSVAVPGVGINAIYVYQSGNVGVSVENNKSYPDSDAQAPTNVVHAYSVSNVTAKGNKFKGPSKLYEGKVLSGFTDYELHNIGLCYLRKGDIVYDINEKPMYLVTGPETGHAGNRPLYSAIFSGTIGTNILTASALYTTGSYGLGCNITIPLSGGGTFKALVTGWTEDSLILDRNLPENIVSQSVTNDVATYETIFNNLDYQTLSKDLLNGTPSEDNYAKLLALVTDAQINNKGLYIPNGSYYCSENLVIQGIRNIVIDGEIVMAPGKMLDIVYNGVSTNGCNWNINTVIGKIRISGVKNGIIKLNDATELELYANGDDPLREAVAYSQFHLGNINTLNVFSEGISEGWINENAFWGGRIDYLNISGNYPHNNNTFYKPMIEGATINIEVGNSNRFYDCRFEGTNVINFGVESFSNVFEQSWETGKGYYLRTSALDSNDATVTDLGVGNRVVLAEDGLSEKQTIYKINYNSNNFPADLILKNQYNLQTKVSWETFFETDLIKLTGDIGIHLVSDIAVCRPRIYFYDENKQLITTSTALAQHVSHYGGTEWGLAYDTDLFSLNSANNSKNFGVAIFKSIPAKYIKIGLAFGGTLVTFEDLELSVRTMNRRTINTTLDSRFQKYTNPAAPTDGYWRIGDIVYNSIPLSGQPSGWICVAEGSPGTWNSLDRSSQIESLSADPVAPTIGQIWLRSDL